MRCHFGFAWLLGIAVSLAGCGGGQGTAPEIPDTPDGTVEAVLDGLVNHRPDVAWRAMPPSYQADVNRLTALFADTVDEAVFDRVIAVSRKATVVLQSKKGLILESRTFGDSGIDPEVFDAGWESAVHMIDEVLASQAADLGSLRELDVEDFLADTGAALMDHAAAMPEPTNQEAASFTRQVAAMQDAEIALVSEEGDAAVVSVAAPGQDPIEIPMRRVEKRWIPTRLADEWPEAVAEVEGRIASMAGEDAAQTNMQLLFGLGMIENVIDQIDQMDNPDDFDALVGGILGGFLQQQAGQAMAEG